MTTQTAKVITIAASSLIALSLWSLIGLLDYLPLPPQISPVIHEVYPDHTDDYIAMPFYERLPL